jgi:hypothetical protein
MKNKRICFSKIMAAIAFVIAMTTMGCKKEKNEGSQQPNIVGSWSHVRQVSTFRNILTDLGINADGSGNEYILSITTGSSTPISDLDFKWTTENNNLLKLQFVDGTSETYTYTLDPEAKLLTLESESGDSKEYIRME